MRSAHGRDGTGCRGMASMPMASMPSPASSRRLRGRRAAQRRKALRKTEAHCHKRPLGNVYCGLRRRPRDGSGSRSRQLPHIQLGGLPQEDGSTQPASFITMDLYLTLSESPHGEFLSSSLSFPGTSSAWTTGENFAFFFNKYEIFFSP